tara:strand:- start:398 stop:517 length:120 start_codon:yes stop_codon:yes gene_type:complete
MKHVALNKYVVIAKIIAFYLFAVWIGEVDLPPINQTTAI